VDATQQRTVGGRPQAVVADLVDALGQDVLQEPTEELVGGQRHFPLLVLVGGVPPAERDLAVGERHQAVVGDRHPVGVAAEVTEGMLRSAEGTLGVDNPLAAEQRPQPGGKGLRLSQKLELAMEVEFGPLEGCDELAAEDFPQHSDRKKERITGVNPSLVIQRQTAGGHDAVDMGMRFELLVPGVEHAEEADLGAEVLGVPGYLQQRLAAGPKQQMVEEPLVLRRQRS